MVSEKRFVVETVEITDCDTDVSRIAKVITDTDETYSYEDLYEVAELLNEQQATIRKLQDLCGKSDGENAKLRIENKRLQEENEQLEKGKMEALSLLGEEIDKNEQLRKELKEIKENPINYF